MEELLDLIDDKLIIKPELLAIEPFNKLWYADKSKNKELANKQIKYIWFYYAFKSPYSSIHPETERHKLISKDICGEPNLKLSKEHKEALEAYKNLFASSNSYRLLDSVESAINKMETYFKNINFEEDDVTKVTNAIINMPKLISAVNQAKEQCKKELSTGIKNRADYEAGLFEDKH